MLRITVNESTRVKSIKLEGKITGPWVEEFSRTWLALAISPSAKEVRVDLRDVAFIDAKGRELLREIYQESKASFLTDSPLTRYFAEEAMRPSSNNGTKGV